MYLRQTLRYLFLIALAGCLTYKSPNSPNSYHLLLASYYDNYAENRAKQYDWGSYDLFRDKATWLKFGQNVGPEKVPKDLPSRAAANLDRAYLVLTSLLKKKAETIIANPEQTAAAQLYFDCWCQQVKENLKVNDISYCQANFHSSIKDLIRRINAEKEFVNYVNDVHSVYFKLGSTHIEQSSIIAMQKLISELQKVDNSLHIVLYGYTDRVGEKKYNIRLAQHRIDAVQNILINSGVIKNDDITSKAFGEKDPLINANTVINNPHSRRVDIFLYKK